MPLNVHYLQHVPFEGLGSLTAWIDQGGHQLGRTRLYAGDPLPRPDGLDLLIVMGGPMGVHDEADYPWLAHELRFIEATIASGARLLGVCLGAQLIAKALGATVHRNPETEIGWFPLAPGADAAASALGELIEPGTPAFHWHGDTFDLPEGALHLASSQACRNQIYLLEDRILGMQCHLETTLEGAHALVEHCADELAGGGAFVQDAETILSEPQRFDQANARMAALLDRLTGEVG